MKPFPMISESFYDESTKVFSGPDFKIFDDKNSSMGQILFEILRRRPNHISQISDPDNTRLTNEDIRLQGIRLARFFETLGLNQDDIVGYAALNTTYAISVPIACFFTGIACHAVSSILDRATMKALFNKTRPKVLFCDGQNIEKILFASSDFETKIVTLSNDVEGVTSIVELLKPTGDEHNFKPADLKYGPDQTLLLLCTSGSTGIPKIASIPNSIPFFRDYNLFSAFGSENTLLSLSTLEWITALVWILFCITTGTVRVITNKPFSTEYILELIEKYKISVVHLLPTVTTTMMKSPHVTPEKFDSIRWFFLVGFPSPKSMLDKLKKYLRKGEIFHAYGTTETSYVSVMSHSEYKPFSVGRLMKGFKACIINREGEKLGRNEIGELCIAFPGYRPSIYETSTKRHKIFDENGWFQTGDICYIDNDNYIYLLGRFKEILRHNYGAFYPREIETIIDEIPDVKEVCVFGIYDTSEGDCAAAAVVKMEGSPLTEQNVIDYVRMRIDAEHKQLHAGCKFFNEIPKTPNLKYDRNATKKLYLL